MSDGSPMGNGTAPTVSAAVPVLFASASACCGCGSCAARCPKGAIDMMEDEHGFRLPRIRKDACVRCGACKTVCGFQRKLAARSGGPFYAAALAAGEPDSASGGVFACLARAVIERGGIVYGAAYDAGEDGLRVRHRRVDSADGIHALQGSKYVQSDATACYGMVERDLKGGLTVLFSGTPCQVAGLKGFLRRDYGNLILVDLVCHGVPSEAMFRGYAESLCRRFGANVRDLRFRCKRDGWDNSRALLARLAGEGYRDVLIPSWGSVYYDLFLNLKTLRDSCYACPFAGPDRPGDLTIGDFWGVERRRPDLLRENGGLFSTFEGVSCLLANNVHGAEMLGELGEGLTLAPVEFDEIAAGNDQLRAPAALPDDRADYISAFRHGGWLAVDRLWRRRTLPARLKRAVSRYLPTSLKAAIKHIIRRGDMH